MADVTPAVKWCGGKGSLLHEFTQVWPTSFNNYYEPFVGGGSVFLKFIAGAGTSTPCYVSDILEPLINMYNVIKSSPEELIKELALPKYKFTPTNFQTNRDHYNRVSRDPSVDPVVKATLFLFLNKTGFNGMYRENGKGFYNIPIGRYNNPTILDEAHLRALHKAFQGVTFGCLSYDKALMKAGPGDFVYLDPPYHGTFTSYSTFKWNDQSQRDLKACVDVLTAKGVKVLLSNSETDFIKDLYKGYTITVIQTKRSINSVGSRRKNVVNEVLIRNY